MSRRHELVFSLNAGGVDPEALARVDLQKMRLAGENPVSNWMSRVLGPMTLRPGSQNLVRISSDAQTRQVRFDRSIGTGYILLLSAGTLRVSSAGAIVQVPNVATVIGSGSWTDVSVAGATATGGATLTFNGTSTASAKLRQAVSVASGDRTLANILRIVVSRGPLLLRVGTTAGGQELIADTSLDDGTHKIAITPGTGVATIYVELRSDDAVTRSVSQIQFEATLLGGAGDLTLPTPWATFADVGRVRHWQSIDVLFCGDGVYQPRRIEHRGTQSWSVVLYKSLRGPWVFGSNRTTMTPGALSGNTTVTASQSTFLAGHVGALLELTQTGKTVQQHFDAVDQVSDYVTIVGVGSGGRQFFRTGVGTAFVGTIVMERSLEPGEPTVWSTYSDSVGAGGTFVDGAATFTRTGVSDGLDNTTAHYRFRVSAYTSGTADMTLEYQSGVQVAVARITGFTSATVVSVETLVNFGNTLSTRSWRIGDWSDVRGWPRTPIIIDSRLNWFRQDTNYGSVPDDYTNFDDGTEGDSAPYTRTVGTAGQDGVLWAMSLDRLVVGARAFEAVIQASELDEPLSTTRYTVRPASRRGSADLEAVAHDDGLFFVQRSGRRIYEMSRVEGRVRSLDISRLNPAAWRPGVVDLAVQQQPETRLYTVLADGTMQVLTYDRDDDVVAVNHFAIAGGLVEDVCVLSETDQDDVHLIVNRSGARYHERLAKEAAQMAVATCSLLDAHKVLTGAVSSITGGTHLASQTVQVWADGARRADVALDGSGVAALGATYARVVYGLNYDATFKSVKLAYAAQLGTALGQTKRVARASAILANSCLDGIRIGRSATDHDPLPDYFNGALRTDSQFVAHYDHELFPVASDWSADERVFIKASSSEGPATVAAIVIDIETRDDGGRSKNG